MPLQHIEVEKKFRLNNPELVKAYLDKHATAVHLNEYQKDDYYSPSHRNFLAKDVVTEWLRLRKSEKGSSITYKDWSIRDGKQEHFCTEYESSIGSFESVEKLLQALDFSFLVSVEKSRSTWQLESCIVSLDTIEDLGTYLEVEASGDFSSTDEALAQVDKIISALEADTGPVDKKGYPMLLIEKAKSEDKSHDYT